MKHYCLGFSIFEGEVALLVKDHPQWAKGKLNGVGGQLDPVEHVLDAMHREWVEETGIEERQVWFPFAVLRFPEALVTCFVARASKRYVFPYGPGVKEPVNWYAPSSLSDGALMPHTGTLIAATREYLSAPRPFLMTIDERG